MAKEYIDHERGQRGLKPCAAAQVYKANAAPDWWPSGVEVRQHQRRRHWERCSKGVGVGARRCVCVSAGGAAGRGCDLRVPIMESPPLGLCYAHSPPLPAWCLPAVELKGL